MGVRSLTSFVAQHSSLRRSLALTPSSAGHEFFIDASAILFNLIPPQGDYATFRSDLRAILDRLKAVNVKSVFIFDGVCDSSKLVTTKSRAALAIKKSNIFMRSVSSKRLRPPQVSLPPLLYLAVIDELSLRGIEMHFAEGEADNLIAELASRRRGFAVSQDSDFFIFNAHDSLGYIPLDSLQFLPPRVPSATSPLSTATISFTFYRHQDLASLLAIPPTFLPLLAALVGNDSTLSASKMLERKDIWSIAQELGKLKHLPIATEENMRIIFDLVQEKLESEPTATNQLIIASQTYTLPPLPTSFSLNPIITDSSDMAATRLEYQQAFSKGRIGKEVLMILKHSIYLNNYHLSDPDRASPIIQLGRPLRAWIYGILREDLGLDGSVNEWVRRGDGLHEVTVEVPVLEGEQKMMLKSKGGRMELFYQIFNLESTAIGSLNLESTAIDSTFLPILATLKNIQSYSKTPWHRLELLAAIVMAALSIERLIPPFKHVQSTIYHLQKSTELAITLQHVSLVSQVLRIDEFGSMDRLFEESFFIYLLSLGSKLDSFLDRLDKRVRKIVMRLLEELG